MRATGWAFCAAMMALAACSSSEGGDATGAGGSTTTAGSGGASTTSTGAGGASTTGAGGDATTSTTTTSTTTTSTTGAGGSGGGMLPAGFECVGSVQYPPAEAQSGTYTFQLVDINQKPFVGSTVTVCAKGDVDCASPLTSGTTDDQGVLTLTIPLGAAGFDGFVEVTGGGVKSTLVFFSTPLTAASPPASALFVLSAQTVSSLAALMGVTPDPARGIVGVQVNDCDRNAAAGAQVSVDTADADTKSTYFANGLPNKNATSTDATGLAGFVNVPVGPMVVDATLAAGSTHVATYSAFVRADWMTNVVLGPTP